MMIMKLAKGAIHGALSVFDLEIRRMQKIEDYIPLLPLELSKTEQEIILDVLENKLSMVSPVGLATTLLACRYVVENEVPGDFVECGVWRGGNALVAAEMFRNLKSDKKVWLFDTFAGMTAPSGEDLSWNGAKALPFFEQQERNTHNEWCYASIEDVLLQFENRGLLNDGVKFIQGDVNSTLERDVLPDQISVLRLDTDWYESTRKELEVLYPRLCLGGVLIIDDYGHWQGSRKAVDEYFLSKTKKPMLTPIDFSVRTAIKTH